MVDGGAAPPQRKQADQASRDGRHGAQDWVADTLLKPFTDIAVKALGSAGTGVANAFDLLIEPQKGVEKGVAGGADMARLALQLVRDAAALALMPDDSPTRLKGNARQSQARGLV